MRSKSTTLDTRVADWLGHSGASFKTGRSGGEIHSFSQQRPRYIYRSFIVFRSASSRGFIKRLDSLKQPESQLDLCYNYGFSKKLEACDIHSDLSPQHRSCSYSYLQLAVMAMSQQSLPPVNQYTGSYTEDTEGDGVRLNAFGHEDANIAYDPLSANRRFAGTADLAVLGTLVFAGPTRDAISVMVPDCLVPPENDTVRIDLRHHIGLSLGPAVDMTNWSPEDHLERALCPGSLLDTLGLQRREYWNELNPILKKWKSVNDSHCPDCQKFIEINMGRHIRLKHTTYMCFWRCPVVSCSLWFTAELNAKDHIEGIHRFKEGHGVSFYECLRRHGIELFGSRQFFEQRKDASQALWMDMALARRSGQELRNSYVITNSPEYAPLRRFFKAAVDALQMVFDRSLVTSVQPRSLVSQMQEAVADCDDGSSDGSLMLLSMPHDIPEVTFPVESSRDMETRDEVTPVVITRRLTPANRPLQLLEAGRLGASTPQHVPSRPAVPDLCIASSSLLSALDPLPLDRISRHTVEEISLWPAADRHAILAVANRDVRVARQNIAELMLYVDDHAAHLANCASANDDSHTLMSAELLPRLEGGIRAVLDEADNM